MFHTSYHHSRLPYFRHPSHSNNSAPSIVSAVTMEVFTRNDSDDNGDGNDATPANRYHTIEHP